MSKYKLTDLKVGAVFKDGDTTRKIIAVCNLLVIYSYVDYGAYRENAANINNFFDGCYGELVKPDVKTKKIKTKRGTLAWAMLQLVKGLKVRRRGWGAGGYIQLTGELNAQRLVTERGGQASGWLHSVDDWELCEEKAVDKP